MTKRVGEFLRSSFLGNEACGKGHLTGGSLTFRFLPAADDEYERGTVNHPSDLNYLHLCVSLFLYYFFFRS